MLAILTLNEMIRVTVNPCCIECIMPAHKNYHLMRQRVNLFIRGNTGSFAWLFFLLFNVITYSNVYFGKPKLEHFNVVHL